MILKGKKEKVLPAFTIQAASLLLHWDELSEVGGSSNIMSQYYVSELKAGSQHLDQWSESYQNTSRGGE